MIIPSKLKIGAIEFKVLVAEDWPGRYGADGECVYDKKRGNLIYIGDDLSEQAKEITLIHEALHAMNSTVDHEFLDSLAEQLYQFLYDNKLLK